MNAPMPWTELATAGAFTTEQVSRLTGANVRAIGNWLRGTPPIILSDFEPINGRRILSFEGLIEARAIAYLTSEGMKTRRLRRLMESVRTRTALRHPMARKQAITTTGNAVFEEEDGKYIDLLNESYAHPELLRPALRGRVEFDASRPLYLQPDPKIYPLVRIDPRRAFGRPVVVEGAVAVPTTTLAEAAQVEGAAGAADWFGVSEGAVQQAIDFEHRLAA